MDKTRFSFTSANSLPVKIFKNKDLLEKLSDGRLFPIHAQVIPTNRCNLNCKFCSCKKRDRGLSLAVEEVWQLASDLRFLGCSAVTVTGGGEPLLYPAIQNLFEAFKINDIKIGLVTNGLLLDNADLSLVTWCRVSCADERAFDDKTQDIIGSAVSRHPGIDWAFSYVLSDMKHFNPENLKRYVNFANEHQFTHIRIVSDLINLDDCVPMDFVRYELRGMDQSRVVYQGRKDFDRGHRDCRISLLKPVIGADGYIYPCCGAQYAHQDSELDMPVDMRMGHVRNIKSIYAEQAWFNGAGCFRCYYRNYNEFLSYFFDTIHHAEFV